MNECQLCGALTAEMQPWQGSSREHNILNMCLQRQGLNIGLNALQRAKHYLHDPESQMLSFCLCLENALFQCKTVKYE